MIARPDRIWRKQMHSKLTALLLGTALIMAALGFAGARASAAVHLDGRRTRASVVSSRRADRRGAARWLGTIECVFGHSIAV
jgi:hypothetical protein